MGGYEGTCTKVTNGMLPFLQHPSNRFKASPSRHRQSFGRVFRSTSMTVEVPRAQVTRIGYRCSIVDHECAFAGRYLLPMKDRPANKDIGVRFGKRIRSLREKRGWSLNYLAAHSGLSKTFLVNLETAKKEPCLYTIETLASSFDLTVGKLMRGL